MIVFHISTAGYLVNTQCSTYLRKNNCIPCIPRKNAKGKYNEYTARYSISFNLAHLVLKYTVAPSVGVLGELITWKIISSQQIRVELKSSVYRGLHPNHHPHKSVKWWSNLTSDNFPRQWSGPRAWDLMFCHLRTKPSATFASILGTSSGFSATEDATRCELHQNSKE